MSHFKFDFYNATNGILDSVITELPRGTHRKSNHVIHKHHLYLITGWEKTPTEKLPDLITMRCRGAYANPVIVLYDNGTQLPVEE